MAMIRPETEMKDSGIEYLGEIPTTWEKCRLKNVCTSFNSNITTSIINKEHGNYKIFGASGLIGYIEFETMQDEYLGIVKDGAGVGRIGSYPSHSSLLGTLAYIIPNDGINMKWLKYVIENMNLGESIDKTTIPHIYFSTYGNNYIPFPSSDEQQAIADYLDETCSKIDEIIAEAKASIDEYKELKQSVIFEAVTKGLNKNVDMKQCSVNWLDEIPSTWESIRLKYLLTEINNRSETGTEQPLSVSQVMGVVPSYMIAVANPTASYVGQKIVEPNDIVFNKLKAHLGVFFMSKYHGLVSPDYAVYRTNDKVIPKYIEYLFHTSACISEFKKYISGVAEGLMRLYTSDLFNIRICLPKVDEQIKIVEYVENKVELFNSLISEKESLINDLEAYKKSRIYEVVTGKRRVV